MVQAFTECILEKVGGRVDSDEELDLLSEDDTDDEDTADEGDDNSKGRGEIDDVKLSEERKASSVQDSDEEIVFDSDVDMNNEEDENSKLIIVTMKLSLILITMGW